MTPHKIIMLKKIIINLILLLSVFWLSFSLLSPLAISFNPFLAILIYLLMFSVTGIQILWVLGAGILFDFFSPLPFGSYLIIFCFWYLLGAYLVEKFFTNRAFSTLVILTLIINVGFLFFLWLESLLLKLFNALSPFVWSWHDIFLQILSNLVFGAIMFGLTKFFTSRLRMNVVGN
jgi:hypothetical protein